VSESAQNRGEQIKSPVVLHEISELKKAKRVDKVKFRKHSGIIRNLRLHYKRFIRPHIFRGPKMHAVSKPGEMLPHYRRGVTHTLFPVLRGTSFSNLRKTGKGTLTGKINTVSRSIQESTKPRL
jgi:hypothetical protein